MRERRFIDVFSDIKEASIRIKEYIKSLSFEEFLKDLKTQDAVVRNFEIIGEAVKFIPDYFKKKHSQIPWTKIAGIRDRLIHHYFGVNYEIIWTIIKEDLEDFEKNIDEFFSDELKKSPQ